MPSTAARPDALANVYAKSLMALAEEHGGPEQAEATLGELQEILELARQEPQFQEFLASRVVPKPKRDAAIERIFAGRADELTVKFLRLLNRKGRLGHLPAITAALDALVQQRFGRVEVDVYTAEPASAETLGLIRDRLSAALGGKTIITHPYTDESIIGGVRMRIGDRLIDASVSTQLRQLKEQLKTRGSTEVKGRSADFLDNSTTNN